MVSILGFLLVFTTSASVLGAALPGQIEAEDYNVGGEGVGYHDTTAGNVTGLYRADDVDIGVDTGTEGGYYVGWVASGEWLRYDVNVAASGSYDLGLRTSRGATGNGAMHVSVDGVNVTGNIAIPPTASWSNFTTVSVPGITLTAGPHQLTVYFDTGLISLNWIRFSAATLPTTPVADPGGSYNALLGDAISFNGSGSYDPDTSGPLTYDWDFGDGSAHGTGVSPSHTYSSKGAYTVTLVVNDGSESSSPVATSATITDGSGVMALPGQIEAEDYNVGGEGVGYHDTTAGNVTGLYRADDVDIGVDTGTEGGYYVGWVASGEWLRYDVNVAASGSYDLGLRTSRGATGNGAMHVSVDGVNVTGNIAIPPTASWSNFTTVSVPGITLTAGPHQLTVYFDTGLISLNWIRFSAATLPTTPVADPGGSYNALLGDAISFNGSGSYDPDTSGPLTYDWDFGDGSAHGTGVSPSHTYSSKGAYTVTLVVNDGSESSSPVATSATITDGSGVMALPGQIEAEDYNVGGEGVGYHDTTAGNVTGLYRADDVDIGVDTGTEGGYYVGWVASGEWLRYDVNVAASGSYDLGLRTSRGATGNGAMHVSVDGVNVTGNIAIPPTASWSNFTTVSVPGITLTAGPHQLTVYFDTGLISLNWIRFSAATLPTTPVADPGGSYNALLGDAISFNGSGSYDPDTSGPLTYDWDFGDGSAHGTGVSPSHTYSSKGAYTVTLVVNDGSESSSPVATSATITDGSGVMALPGQIEAEDYNVGGEGVGYHDTTAGNVTGLYRADDVDIGVDTGTEGGYYVGWVASGEWLRYDVNVAASGSYDLGLRTSRGATGNGAMHVSVDGVNVTGNIAIPPTASWSNFTTVSVPGITLTAGPHQLTVYFDTGLISLNWISFKTSMLNEALFATPTVSSSITTASQFEANDGIKNSTSNGWQSSDANPWIQLNFDSVKTISKLVLTDLPGSQNVLDATVDFSDGSSFVTGVLPDNGTPKEFTFTPKETEWVRVTINSANSTNKGLAEIEALSDLGGQQKIVEDLFNDGNANGWVVTNNCQVGSSTWQVVSNPLLVVKNMYQQNNTCRGYSVPDRIALGTYSVLTGLTHNDVDVRLRIRSNFNGDFLQAGMIGLMFGYQNDNNYYRVDLSQRDGHRKLIKRVGGTFTELATSPQSYTPGEWTNLRVVKRSNVIVVFVNGKQALAAQDNSFSSGKLALFCAQNTSCLFDNVYVLSAPATPLIGLTAPSEYFVETSGILDVAAVVTNTTGVGGVEFVVDEEDTINKQSKQDLIAPYSKTFDFSAAFGEHTVRAYLLSDDGIPVRLTHDGAMDETVAGVNGLNIVAMGDSLTEGIGDNLGSIEPNDDTSDDQRNASGGYQPVLNNYLAASNVNSELVKKPVTVLTEANPGEKSSGGAARIVPLLARTPEAQAYLVQYGANDVGGSTPIPSGLGLHPGESGYAGSFKDNMKQIIVAVTGVGKQIFFAKTSTQMTHETLNPDLWSLTLDYHAVIDELINENGLPQVPPDLLPPPDFLTYFINHPDEMGSDDVHPIGQGYAAEAGLWCASLNNYRIGGTAISCVSP